MARLRPLAHTAGVLTITTALLTAVFTSPASACSCVPSTEGERYQRAQHVFSGRVTAVETEQNDPSTVGDDRYRFRVEVQTEYKGDVPPAVDVLTSIHSGTCGITMSTGSDYLIFATGDSSDARVETNYCSGTRLAAGGPPVTTVPTSPTNSSTNSSSCTLSSPTTTTSTPSP
ncbi:hypothetical protein [Saccharothrix syringae]|uniref:Tissue inhibitor of metalloproteinase n=1 Tax=Saccharothrix syringae TaxID=103733 RepID=A0A5Q0GYE7_SACSY|nr:hypothetical protein [Saccharothrix syringae]QFZ18981.1 hypothetical protein EKG83_17360 [Saccharothrix syringae]